MTAGPCPFCGSPSIWRGGLFLCSAPTSADCPAGDGNALTKRQYLDEVAHGQLTWWRSLDDFMRAVLREPEAERAVARVALPLLRFGVDAEVVQAIARAANSLRVRPALTGAVDETVLRVARELAAERRGAAA